MSIWGIEMLSNMDRYLFKFMNKNEHDTLSSFDHSIKNRIVLNIASKFDESWVGHYGCSTNESSKKSYSGIIAYSPALILDNIDEDSEKITFLINGQCSMDYIVSILFSIHLIEFGKLPKYYREILNYIEAVEADEIKITDKNIINPFTIIKSLPYLESLKKIKDINDKNEYILKRGLRIIEYIHMRLDKLNNYNTVNLFDKSLIESKCEFQEEISILKKDYELYLIDTKGENNGIVLKEQLKVYSNEDNKKTFVDTLIFLKPSNSIFCKYWARNDSNSPSGSGYSCILNIENRFNGKRTEERKKMEQELFEKNIVLNRYTVSVDPMKGLNIYGLGMYLELFEQMKEEKIFNNDFELINKWRDRSNGIPTRFRDSKWCINQFPWYDGRVHNFTQVDSSSIDSLLNINEVIFILRNFTEEYIEEVDLSYIYTFNYKYTDFKKIKKLFTACSGIEKSSLIVDKHYFLDIIKDYFDDKINDSIEYYSLNIRDFKVLENIITDELNSNNIMKKFDVEQVKELFDFECKIYLFGYGVGFIDLKIKSNKLNFSYIFSKNIENLNKRLLQDFETVMNLLSTNEVSICNNKKINININNCNVFHWIKIYNDRLSIHNKSNVIQKLINEHYNNNLLFEPKHMINRKEYVIGFSKKGTISIVLPDNQENNKLQDCINNIKSNNYKRHFPIYLFVLHQRQALIRFSEMLYYYDKQHKTKEISELRLALLKFVTQSWFSQLTEDEFGMNLYNIWAAELETDKLLAEIDSQVSTLDDYNKNRISNIIEIASIIGFPILALSTVFGMNILQTKGVYIKLEYVFIIAAASFTIGVGLLKRFKLF